LLNFFAVLQLGAQLINYVLSFCTVCDMLQGGAWSQMMSDEVEIDDIGILPSQPSAPKRKAI
jgi:hypothetical protein